MQDEYLKAGRASDLENPRDRAFFRLGEMLPGILSFGTLFLVVLLSWLAPLYISVFIMIFGVFWFFRSVYFSFHLNSSYKKMRANEKEDWIRKLENMDMAKSPLPASTWRDIYHLVLLPVYKEPLEIARETFLALRASDYPKDRMIIVLSAEESNREHLEILTAKIKEEFGNDFFKLFITWHPRNIPGEIQGHGANDAWASKEVQREVIDPLGIPYENIIVSSFDIDTCVYPKYFSCLAYHYLTCKNPVRTGFQPIPLYFNNIWEAPFISRIFSFSSTFWQMVCQERPEILLTFSSHATSFRALVDIGFKQVNVVQDDSRLFWQCFLRYDGDYRVDPIFYPVSMDANVAATFWRTLGNIYKQKRRWAYGAGDIPYFLLGFSKNKKISFHKKIALTSELIFGHWSWATVSIMLFILGWLPIVLGGTDFSQTYLSYNLPKTMSLILTSSMFGLVSSFYLSVLLLPPRPANFGSLKYLLFAVEWVLLPFVMVFFTAFPALDAQARWMFGKYMGFWATEKVRK